MGTIRLKGEGVFSRRGGELAEFLSEVGLDPSTGDRCFLGRNFLLDEAVPEPRADSYVAEGAAARHADLNTWTDRHQDYLKRRVRPEQPPVGPPGTLNPARPEVCPETFRFPEAFSFAAAKTDLYLLRVVNARKLAQDLVETEGDILGWAREVLASGDRESAAGHALAAALGRWSSQLDLRPVYATFWEDQRDLFEFEKDRPDWADALRDRLGLLHLSPRLRGEIPVLVFRYPVSEVPRHAEVRDGRPLAAPTVLDGELCEAFCPAPRGQTCGRVVDLSAPFEEPSREVVHPFFPYRIEHLFRLGAVRRPVPSSLRESRKTHLMAVQTLCSRPDYGMGTDGDLLS
ncbi:MAG TPA: hypothetical protein VH394_16175 [Thermoanaerobaculia bacterium]|jgi:hypothetical protein|nr:hypothetical protein [Thermoanaerobaculia bacterium]